MSTESCFMICYNRLIYHEESMENNSCYTISYCTASLQTIFAAFYRLLNFYLLCIFKAHILLEWQYLSLIF